MGFQTQRNGQENISLTSEFPPHTMSFFLFLTFHALYFNGHALVLSPRKNCKVLTTGTVSHSKRQCAGKKRTRFLLVSEITIYYLYNLEQII